MNSANRSIAMISTLFLGLAALGLTSISAHADGHYKLVYEKLCGTDMACTAFNYCTGCHQGVVIGATVIAQGKMKPQPGDYQAWVSRLKRMSLIGCHIPQTLIAPMAAYLDSLDNLPLTAKEQAKAKTEAMAKAKAEAENPGKSNVEFYCVGCHDGLVAGNTIIGSGRMKPKPMTYDQWMLTIQRMSERKSSGVSSSVGAHIPPNLIPAMAVYLDGLDNSASGVSEIMKQ